MPKPTPYKYRLLYLLAFIVVFIIGIPILIFYSAGYTFDRNLGVISPRGGIYVYTPDSGTSVFVGNELKSTSGFFKREVLVDGLKSGQYLVLAANTNDWPWAKIVNVKAGEVEALFPLMVPKTIDTTRLVAPNPSYAAAVRLFSTSTTETSVALPPGTLPGFAPGTSTAATSTSTPENVIESKKILVWVGANTDGSAGNSVYAKWLGSNESAPHYFCDETDVCTKPVLVFPSALPIHHVDFYPSRNDAIILALDNGIYAVEIDRRPYQNFYPLYRGQAPDFRESGGEVFVKDNGAYSALILEK